MSIFAKSIFAVFEKYPSHKAAAKRAVLILLFFFTKVRSLPATWLQVRKDQAIAFKAITKGYFRSFIHSIES